MLCGDFMRLLSFTVPCYNSQDYMEKCVSSLLYGGNDVEILIINDGSSDSTGEIADRLQREHPQIIRAIHQENSGHGGAVNTGLKNARGRYFKVVDSDDWVDESAYDRILSELRNFGESGPDMILSNYVYEKQGKKNKKTVSYYPALPRNKEFSWDNIRFMVRGQYILMHSVIYRTDVLRSSGMVLPNHTYYVDNLFVFQPLPYVRSLYYLDVDFYRYFIGREDQSVNEAVMIKRVDQQIRVTKLMIDFFCVSDIPNKKLRRYMRKHLEINMAISSIMLLLSGTEENFRKKIELWTYLLKHSKLLFLRLRLGLLGLAVHLPGRGGRQVSIYAYEIVRRHFGFN